MGATIYVQHDMTDRILNFPHLKGPSHSTACAIKSTVEPGGSPGARPVPLSPSCGWWSESAGEMTIGTDMDTFCFHVPSMTMDA
eukprot:1881871-Pyramimonas_sp.AAC.1